MKAKVNSVEVVLVKVRVATHSAVYEKEGANMKAKVNGTEVEGTPEEKYIPGRNHKTAVRHPQFDGGNVVIFD